MRRRSATPPRDVAGVKPRAVNVLTAAAAAFRLVCPPSSAAVAVTLSEAATLLTNKETLPLFLAPFRLAVADLSVAETIEARMDSGLEGGVRS